MLRLGKGFRGFVLLVLADLELCCPLVRWHPQASVQPHPAGRGSAHMHMTQAGSVYISLCCGISFSKWEHPASASKQCMYMFPGATASERWPDHDPPTGPDEICPARHHCIGV
jgi:hypothetical protein